MLPTVVKLDVDAVSCITYNTESSNISQGPPSSIASSEVTDSSALAMRLNFLARQLELERKQREKLTS